MKLRPMVRPGEPPLFAFAALALLPSLALALSSHSPQDLFAFPQYKVVLDDQGVLNETVPAILAEARELAAASPDEPHPALHLLRTPAGQAFLCSVPISRNTPTPPPTPEDLANRVAERERGLERGLALLNSMKGGCLYQKQGYFTYSFCYGQDIRQFHEVRLQGSPGPSEDPNADSYTLGQSPAPVAALNPPKYGSGSGLVTKGEQRIPATLGGGSDAGFGWDEGGRYLSQKWEGGTICDKTGMPRSVEVQFHCNTNAGDRIALIRETAICTYVLLIHTPRLCSEPIFLEGTHGSQDPPSVIQCQPVVKKIREAVDPPAVVPPGVIPQPEADRDQLHVEPGVAPQPPVVDPLPTAPTSPPAQQTSTPYREDIRRDDDEDGLLGLDSVTLVYDPTTGVILSAEADGEELFYDDEGPYEDDERRDHHHHGESREGDAQRERDELAAIDGLQDLAKIMQKSITEALRLHADRERRPGAVDGAQQPHREGDPIVVPGGVAVDGLDGLLAAINRGIKRETDLSKAGSDSRARDPLSKYLEKLGGATERKNYQALVAELGDEMKKKADEAERFADSENARLAKSFNRKYEDDEGEHAGATLDDRKGRGRVKDEL